MDDDNEDDNDDDVECIPVNSYRFLTFSSGAGAAKWSAKERYNDPYLRDKGASAPCRATALSLTTEINLTILLSLH